MMLYRASGPFGSMGCGLALVFLGLFLLTPLAVFLIRTIGWGFIVLGILVAVLGFWAWWRGRHRF